MPDRTCPHCRVKGFIRSETIINGGRATQSCYCGHCGRTWEADDCELLGQSVHHAHDRPTRSRKP